MDIYKLNKKGLTSTDLLDYFEGNILKSESYPKFQAFDDENTCCCENCSNEAIHHTADNTGFCLLHWEDEDDSLLE